MKSYTNQDEKEEEEGESKDEEEDKEQEVNNDASEKCAEFKTALEVSKNKNENCSNGFQTASQFLSEKMKEEENDEEQDALIDFLSKKKRIARDVKKFEDPKVDSVPKSKKSNSLSHRLIESVVISAKNKNVQTIDKFFKPKNSESVKKCDESEKPQARKKEPIKSQTPSKRPLKEVENPVKKRQKTQEAESAGVPNPDIITEKTYKLLRPVIKEFYPSEFIPDSKSFRYIFQKIHEVILAQKQYGKRHCYDNF